MGVREQQIEQIRALHRGGASFGHMIARTQLDPESLVNLLVEAGCGAGRHNRGHEKSARTQLYNRRVLTPEELPYSSFLVSIRDFWDWDKAIESQGTEEQAAEKLMRSRKAK